MPRKDSYRFQFPTLARMNEIARHALSSHPKVILWTSMTDLTFSFEKSSGDGLHYRDGTTNLQAGMVFNHCCKLSVTFDRNFFVCRCYGIITAVSEHLTSLSKAQHSNFVAKSNNVQNEKNGSNHYTLKIEVVIKANMTICKPVKSTKSSCKLWPSVHGKSLMEGWTACPVPHAPVITGHNSSCQ